MALRVRKLFVTDDLPGRRGRYLCHDAVEGKIVALARLIDGIEEVDFWDGLARGLEIGFSGIEEFRKDR